MPRRSLLPLALTMLGAARAQDGNFDDIDDQDIEEQSLTAEQMMKLHATFDLNSDGKASFKELMDYSQEIGKAMAAKDILLVLEELDANKDGVLSLEEHLTDVANQADGGDEIEMKELAERKKLEDAKFKAADRNRDGFLDNSEIPALFYPETHEPVLHITVQHTMLLKDTNGDGMLNPHEFWEAVPGDPEMGDLSPEEHADFAKMDFDKNGHIDLDELRHWESGRFHTEESMRRLFEIADKNDDMHLTAAELAGARKAIAVSDAQYHLVEWAEHHEL